MHRRTLYAAAIALIMNLGLAPFGALQLASAQTAATTYDGVYKPTSSSGMALSGRAMCNNAMSTLRITNGIASMTWRGLMQGPVGPDGSVSISSAGSKLDGKISNGVLDGKVSTPVCVYTVTLTKS